MYVVSSEKPSLDLQILMTVGEGADSLTLGQCPSNPGPILSPVVREVLSLDFSVV